MKRIKDIAELNLIPPKNVIFVRCTAMNYLGYGYVRSCRDDHAELGVMDGQTLLVNDTTLSQSMVTIWVV